jgi:hypothetical protein
MKLLRPEFLYWLPVVWAALAWVFWRNDWKRREAIKAFGPQDTGFSKKRVRIDRGLLFVIVAMLTAALARPMYFLADDRDELQGAPYLIALDTSRSMLAVDVRPTRYEASVLALDGFFAETKSDHIGLLTFAGVAYLNSPMTFDMTALRTILTYIDPFNTSDPGSSIGSAIDRAGRFFRSNSIPERTLIILSDGEDLEGRFGRARGVDGADLASKRAGDDSHHRRRHRWRRWNSRVADGGATHEFLWKVRGDQIGRSQFAAHRQRGRRTILPVAGWAGLTSFAQRGLASAG